MGTVITPADLMSATWIDPLGTAWPLTDTRFMDAGGPGYFTPKGVKGLGAAGVAYTTDNRSRGGVTVRTVYNPARTITWPLFYEGRTRAEYRATELALCQAFTCTQRRGPGTLVITQPDGTQRAIQAYYGDGWDLDPDSSTALSNVVVLTLLCPTPWFRAIIPTQITRAYTGPGSDFLSPFPQVSSSQAFGATTFINPGELPAWPDWQILGPASTVSATNVTRGETWALDMSAYRGSALAIGEVVTMTSDPPAVSGPDGTSWYGALNNPAAALWRLDEGRSDITFTVGGAGATTAISASFYQQYESA